MCTHVIAWQVLADAPLAVAANRDEELDRPSSPPRVVEGDPRVVAPRDDEAGGTWLGYNEHGLFVGLSNRWTDAGVDGDRSRGRLVLDLLGARSADRAASSVEAALGATSYEPFNVVLADAETAVLLEWDGRLRVSELPPGVHVVLNAGWDDQFAALEGREDVLASQVERAHWLRRVLAVADGETAAAWLDRAAEVLADHDHGVCVHGDGYGTRSSSLVALADGGVVTFRFADGPPCEIPYAPVDEQI